MTAAALVFFVATSPGVASPGAHGPDGEHLDGPPSVTGRAGSAPRMESKSEQFELVATLGGGELSILIDRFETNEPVLNARVEIESGSLKAGAKFHADQGDYAVDDPALLKALSQPGSHPIVVTFVAGRDSDLLEGTLQVTTAVAAADPGHGHAHGEASGHGAQAAHAHDDWRRLELLIAGLAVLGIGALWWRRRNRLAASSAGVPR
nr:hypothetical protein [Schlegelella koreensis]